MDDIDYTVDWMSLSPAALEEEIERRKRTEKVRTLRFSRKIAALTVQAVIDSELSMEEINKHIGRGKNYVNREIAKMLAGKGSITGFITICHACGFEASFQVTAK